MTLKIFDLKVHFLFLLPLGSPFFANVKKIVQMNQYTYNVHSGSSATSLKTSAKREFVGVGRVNGDEKCPSNFFILFEYIDHVYTYYLYIYLKIFTNILMGFKIL